MKKAKNKNDSNRSLTEKTISGSKWIFFLRVLRRIFSFGKNIVLARLLLPQDFGLMGIALTCIVAFAAFSQTGVRAALVQKKEKITQFLDSAWTIQCLRGVINVILIYFSAPYVASFFHEPSATELIRVFSLVELFRGITSIHIVFFQKQFEFNKQVCYELTGIAADLLISIPLAYFLRNAWALVFGLISNELMLCIMSYVIYPYRPRFEFSKAKILNLYNYGKWIQLQYLFVFVRKTYNNLIVGRFLGASPLGLYSMANTIANISVTEIGQSISQVIFPAYSVLQDDENKIKQAFIKIETIVFFIAVIYTLFIFTLGESFIICFLGEKWIGIIIPLKILSIATGMMTVSITVSPFFDGIGKPQIRVFSDFIFLISLVVFSYPLTIRFGIIGASIAYLISAFLSSIMMIVMAIRCLSISAINIGKIVVCPICIFTINYFIVYSLKVYIYSFNEMYKLGIILIVVVIGIFVMLFLMEKLFSYGVFQLFDKIFFKERLADKVRQVFRIGPK